MRADNLCSLERGIETRGRLIDATAPPRLASAACWRPIQVCPGDQISQRCPSQVRRPELLLMAFEAKYVLEHSVRLFEGTGVRSGVK